MLVLKDGQNKYGRLTYLRLAFKNNPPDILTFVINVCAGVREFLKYTCNNSITKTVIFLIN